MTRIKGVKYPVEINGQPEVDTTNGIALSDKPFSLADLDALIGHFGKPVFGFIVSSKIYSELYARTTPMQPGYLLGGVTVITDPKLGDTEFETVFTREAWQKRLAEINS